MKFTNRYAFKIKNRFEIAKLASMIYSLLMVYSRNCVQSSLFSWEKQQNQLVDTYSALQKPLLKPQIIAKLVQIKWIIYFMYDFAKSLQVPVDGFAPHLQGFSIKLHQHKQTKVFSVFTVITKTYAVLYYLWLWKTLVPGFPLAIV